MLRLTLCAALVGCAFQVAAASDSLPERSASGTKTVAVIGAVVRPGAVSLPEGPSDVSSALMLVGGPDSDAYLFAAILLRERMGEAVRRSPFACVTPAARHAALLISTGPQGENLTVAKADLLGGRLERLPLGDRNFGRLGFDRGLTVELRAGDTVALPTRTDRVWIVIKDGSVRSVAHRPQWDAREFLAEVSHELLAASADYVMHYPDGRTLNLTLQPWNHEPVAVPPGAMLAPAASCLPVVD